MKALHVSKAKSGVIKTYQMIVRVQKGTKTSTCNRNGKTIIPRENFSPLTKKKSIKNLTSPLKNKAKKNFK